MALKTHGKRKLTFEQRADRATFGLFRVFKSQVKKLDPKSLERVLRINRGASMNTMADVFNRMMELTHGREHLYREFEEIVEDSAVASALELMTDDAIPFNQDRGRSMWIESDDETLAKELNQRLDELGVEANLWDWTFTTAMYGDFMLSLDTKPGKGVISVDDSIHPIDVERVDINGRLVAFRDRTEREGSQFKTPFDFVHFRIMGSYVRKRQDEFGRIRRRTTEGSQRFRMTTKYGVSIIAPARRPWRQLTLVENTMIMNRIQRNPRVIYKLILTDPDPALAAEYVEMYEEKLLKQRNIDKNEGRLNSIPNDLAMGDDVVLPTSNLVDIEITEVGKNIDVRGIADVEYLRNRFYGSLKVPQAFLGFEDSLPGGLGDNSLFFISTRYARTVKRIQRTMCDGLKKLLIIDYMLRHPNSILRPAQFRCTLDITSTAEELERRQAMQLISETVKTITETAGDLGVKGGLEAPTIMAWAIDRIMPGLGKSKFFDERKAREFRDKMMNGEQLPGNGQGKPGQTDELETDALDKERSANPIKKPPEPRQNKNGSQNDSIGDLTRTQIRHNLIEYSPPQDPDLWFFSMARFKKLEDAKGVLNGSTLKEEDGKADEDESVVAFLNSDDFQKEERSEGESIMEALDKKKKEKDRQELKEDGVEVKHGKG